jgi:tetratricopeptide (TPR) repeat protein
MRYALRGVRNGFLSDRLSHLVRFLYLLGAFVAVLFTSKSTAQSSASGQLLFSPALHKAQASIFQLHFDEAAPLLRSEELKRPDNKMVQVLKCKQLFFTAFIDEKTNSEERFLKESAALIDQLEKTVVETNPLNGFCRAELLLFRVMLQAKRQEYWTAALDLRRCHALMEKNKVLFPSFVPNGLINGAVECTLGAVPYDYRWILQLIGWEGDVNSGMRTLSSLLRKIPGSEYDSFTDELLFLMGSLHASLTPDQLPDDLLLQLLSNHCQENKLLKYVYTGLLMRQGKNDAALLILNSPEDPKATIKLPLMHYRRGLALLRKMDGGARAELLTFVQLSGNGNCVKAAWQKLAWQSLLQNDLQGYRENMSQCQRQGRALIDEDKDALREAEAGVPPNHYLLRSRLYFDGGYYIKAMQCMSGVPADSFPSVNEKLELTYRFARILDAMGRKEQAVIYYKLTLKNGQSSSAYFAANSALLLGVIYEKRGDCVTARKYYKECLSLRHHDYQNSIDQKAKAALQRCE